MPRHSYNQQVEVYNEGKKVIFSNGQNEPMFSDPTELGKHKEQ